MDIASIKKVSRNDLANFLNSDDTDFNVLTANLKIIDSTKRTSVTLSKNSAKSFYLGKKSLVKTEQIKVIQNSKDDCLTDAQNCEFFTFFNSKEKKLYTRFNDKCEANFEGSEANQPLLFLTLTFNTSQDDLFAWTTNWNSQDECWNRLSNKKSYDLKKWAQAFDPTAQAMKVKIGKISSEEASNSERANVYVAKFLRAIRAKWKPSNWKWTIVSELQKRGVWHFHLLSTPIVPYVHKCTLDKNFTACWNCRTFLNSLWKWGRVELRSPGRKTISKYLAKYISKSFHLRSLYAKHGLKENHKVYRFFKNLYNYEEKPALLIDNKHKIDQQSLQPLAPNQHLFKKTDNTYCYRTNERLVAQVKSPYLAKKSFRLQTRHLHVPDLLKLAKKHPQKETLLFTKSKEPLKRDFQEFIITNLLLMCDKANFIHVPLEQNEVPKNKGSCTKSVEHHFQTKSVLHFIFKSQNSELVKNFFAKLDDYANDYQITESQDFYYYPTSETSKDQARNHYLNRWTHQISDYQTNNYSYANNF